MSKTKFVYLYYTFLYVIIQCLFLSVGCTYTILSFYEELDSLGIISKGICIERLFDQISFYNNKPNYDLTLELIHILYKNLLISEMINNLVFFVRLFLIICSFERNNL